jgi:hypothetical protein
MKVAVKPLRATLAHLASSVHSHDYFRGNTSVKQIEHILDIALTSEVGLHSINIEAPIEIVLGNRFVLSCTVFKADQ